MSLPSFSVHKRVTVVMLTLGLVMIGVISFTRLPQELFPQIVFPQLTVVTDYTNAAPEEIETLITKPIEEALGSVSGLRRIESVSREGRSTITVSFNWGQDIDFAALAVREKIDLIKERFPKESGDPVVLKYDPLSRPIMILSVSGKDIQPVRLKFLAEKIIKNNLEKVEGVASVSLSGGLDREILVDIDQGRLQANNLSLLEVIESVESANVTYPAGSIKKGLYEYLIRTVGEFKTVKEIEYAVAGVDTVKKFSREEVSFLEQGDEGPRETVDGLRGQKERSVIEKRLVLIRDIGKVIDGTAERTSVSRYNGQENISISIQKQASANTIRLVDALGKALSLLDEDIKQRGMSYEIVYDHSIFIRESLRNLVHDALAGGVLAFLSLLAFLRAPLPALVVTTSIPLTILGVFFMMVTGKITINVMSLGGLALGLGMIVDTSVVIMENIFRKRQGGLDPEAGAIQASEEVQWPVITSNLTTIAVFFPLIVFVPGIVGQLFKDLSWAVIFSQIVSAILPLTLIPMLSIYLKIQTAEYRPIPWTNFFIEKTMKASPVKSNLFLAQIFLIALGICSVAFFIVPRLEREVLPKVDQGKFFVKLELPLGSRLEITDKLSQKIEAILDADPDIKDISVTIGSEKSKKGEVSVEILRPCQALILVTLNEKRKISSADVVQRVKGQLEGLNLEGGRVDYILQESEFSFAEGGAKPILVEVQGYDFIEAGKLADQIKEALSQIHGVMNVQDDRGESADERKVIIHKERAALYGISALDVSLITKAAIDGVVATYYREGGNEYDIRVRLNETDRKNVENLNNLLLFSQVLNSLIPLKDIAEIQRGLGPSEIKHLNQERTIVVSADIKKGLKSKDVLENVKKVLRTVDIHPDFRVDLSGKAREIKENFSKVIFALVLSLFLIYMIMASQFESFLQPLIIMWTVPLGFFGVSLALVITHTTLNVISMLGVIILGGVVVNNGIVLIEYINQLREEGMETEMACWEAAKIRTRPILMTAISSILGMLPLAIKIGQGAELYSPMAVSLIGGMLTSTFLTLIVIPSSYILVTRFTERFFSIEEDDDDEDDDAAKK